MAGYLGTKAVFLSTTAASVVGNSTIGGDLTVDTDTFYVDSTNNRVGIGTASPQEDIHITSTLPTVRLEDSDDASYGEVLYNVGSGGLLIRSDVGSTAGSNSNIIMQVDGSEAMRIDNSGHVGINETSPAYPLHVSGVGFFDTDVRVNSSGTTPALSNSLSDTGARIRSGGASHLFSSYSDQVLLVNRAGTDGALITFYGQGNAEGAISVSGSTVTYGGGHLARWSRLPNDVVTDIPKGTVMTNLDDMITWIKQDGTVEDNEQLNYTEISSVEGDVNVAGLFDHWDDDDDGEGYDSDFFLAETGDFIIRIAQGVTVQRGDLLMSAGDGTAKPQDDDIIRSKTVAKVTSTHVTCTYDDGSYCVPCVIMAC